MNLVTDEIKVLKALAHPVRLDILRRLAAEPDICACDFTDYFAVSQPTVSAHLRTLREAGLVSSRRDGNTICYSLVPGAVRRLADTLVDLAEPAPRPARL
ncbi:MAG TPA: metalloregulator ArsR/SmtB family transcription factor [Stackebrandtia sp.]|jgi:ArsR family transcriptional regulator|uniref:ArsR/SmtB family transcription factor n=1 Tax=Stackebrandtia sp. TaxID=2023065 RepID=UPI002D564824|nr:metalloregulator ArsR/SmtB family transcription factor [Stackebrandtia sp.]HZE41476.1 metalloregulator ArsR/SmtB family transcription factor [Stackebrandtia sp.]